MGCHVLLQGIFSTQEWNPGLLHFRQILYQLSYKGSPLYAEYIMLNAGLDESKLESRLLGEVSTTLEMQITL